MVEFEVLSLNCWGLWRISLDRDVRMEAIANKLLEEKYTFVLLQELWVRSDYNKIYAKVKDIYPFAHHFQGGAIGSGLAILSQAPIENVILHEYTPNGKWYKPWHGDWFAGKGIAVAQVVYSGLRINLLTTHTHVDVGPEEQYKAVRFAQSITLADFINSLVWGADATILAGDLNTNPEEYFYCTLKAVGQLHDTWDTAETKFVHPSIYFEKRDIGATCNLPSNTYCPEHYKDPNRATAGSRLDYCLYRPGLFSNVRVKRHARPLPNRIPGSDVSYSDHEALHISFEVTPKKDGVFHPLGDPQRMQFPLPPADENNVPSTASLLCLSDKHKQDAACVAADVTAKRQTVILLEDAIYWLDRQLAITQWRCRWQFILGCILFVLLLGFLIIPVNLPWWAFSLIGLAHVALTLGVVVYALIQPVFYFREKRALLQSRTSAALKAAWLDQQLGAISDLRRRKWTDAPPALHSAGNEFQNKSSRASFRTASTEAEVKPLGSHRQDKGGVICELSDYGA